MIQRRDKKRTASAKRIQAAFLEENHIDIEEIPPKEEYVRDTVNKQLRVCAYCRVSTDEESQQSSYELQVQHYTEYINKIYELRGYAKLCICGLLTVEKGGRRTEV